MRTHLEGESSSSREQWGQFRSVGPFTTFGRLALCSSVSSMSFSMNGCVVMVAREVDEEHALRRFRYFTVSSSSERDT